MGLKNKPDINFQNAYTQVPSVGKSYNVICIEGVSWASGETLRLPILGLPHIDKREVGTEDGTLLHQHIDVRFITDAELKSMGWNLKTQGAFVLGKGKFKKNDSITTRCWWEVREMLRDFSYTPCVRERKKFTKKYVGCKMEGMKCPHQGIDIKSVPFQKHEGKKIRVCPGHLLMFDKKNVCIG